MKKKILVSIIFVTQFFNLASANWGKDFAESFTSDYRKLSKKLVIKKKDPNETKKMDISQEISEKKEEGYVLYSTNKINEAYQIFTQIDTKYLNEQDYVILANIAQDKGSLIDAVTFLEKSIAVNPKFYKSHYNLGVILQKQGKDVSAKQEYQKAIRYNATFPYTYYNLGCIYLKEKDYRRAKRYFTKAVELNNKEPDFYYNLSLSYKKLEDNQNAEKNIKIYNELLKKTNN